MDIKLAVLGVSLLAFGCLEGRWPWLALPREFAKRMRSNVLLGGLNAIAASVTTGLLLKTVWSQCGPGGILDPFRGSWLIFPLSFLVLDCYLYFWHRCMHKIPFAWKFHQVHHSDSWMNISTAYRFHILEVLASHLPRVVVIWLFGIPPAAFWLYEVILTAELVFHHSNWALPWRWDRLISQVFVTPHFHRIHHGQEFERSGCNYGSLLTLWDRLFGSRRYTHPDRPVTIGLLEQDCDDMGVRDLIAMPFRQRRKRSLRRELVHF
jgi:sterol desaturase/sphingolipid hydroxylase (fatty acid hydroxylase superfamily)